MKILLLHEDGDARAEAIKRTRVDESTGTLLIIEFTRFNPNSYIKGYTFFQRLYEL